MPCEEVWVEVLKAVHKCCSVERLDLLQGMFEGQQNAAWLPAKSAAASAASIHHCGSCGKTCVQSIALRQLRSGADGSGIGFCAGSFFSTWKEKLVCVSEP